MPSFNLREDLLINGTSLSKNIYVWIMINIILPYTRSSGYQLNSIFKFGSSGKCVHFFSDDRIASFEVIDQNHPKMPSLHGSGLR